MDTEKYIIEFDVPYTGHEEEFYNKAVEIGSKFFPYMPDAATLRDFDYCFSDDIEVNVHDFGITVNGEMVGFCNLISFQHVNFVDLLSVIPEYQRQGLATEMLTYCIEEYPNPIITMADVETESTRWQKAFLEKNGFVMTPLKLDFHGGVEQNVFIRGRVEMWEWTDTLDYIEAMWQSC